MINYKVGPRGIGSDMTPGCYCCGGEYGLYSNVAFFVVSKEDGEAVTALFKQGARLDYRKYEPYWIQVKVGVCVTHFHNLEKLLELVLRSHEGNDRYACYINAQTIEESKKIGDE